MCLFLLNVSLDFCYADKGSLKKSTSNTLRNTSVDGFKIYIYIYIYIYVHIYNIHIYILYIYIHIYIYVKISVYLHCVGGQPLTTTISSLSFV